MVRSFGLTTCITDAERDGMVGERQSTIDSKLLRFKIFVNTYVYKCRSSGLVGGLTFSIAKLLICTKF